ncbi:phosphatidate cytidylyltransferase [Komagataeibacter medellinensis]|uniref:Phosphatidate cytidylyltransferase n=2 Tax=Komagataeibacter medellinensis TaxID=1177712 RepID=G2I2L3_KOMMN|nr:phosphatidate cytidylyltransferase [Komagataeibacter medellinensis]KAB8123427.1 phosphatidate cytidylyltransferase [Komagataeibacter medellinensis]BAK84992.1 phosphatidate cytidylyltransferase [Komagataeibacter medellinensis NBRC 3288]
MPDQSENISRPSAPVPSGNWKDLRARVLSAAVLVPLAALCVWVGGLVYGAMIVLAMVGMAAEWARMFGFGLDARRGQLCLVWAACTGVAAVAGHWGGALLVMAAALVLGPALWAGQVAIGCAGLSLLWLRYMSEPGAGVVLFLVACVALSDTGAYMAGRLFGGPKLAPRISPAKTWSGSVGGLCCAVVAGMLIAALLPGAQPGAVWRGAVFGGLVAIAAQMGDLAESALKRKRGVKDSGTLLPGHGGLLDRFDGLLVAAPMAALLSLGAAGGAAFWYVGLH